MIKMANHRQRNRKLARARFHQQQCHDRNRSMFGRGRKATIVSVNEPVQENPRNARNALMLDTMTRDELRGMAAKLNIRGRSIMTKDALIKAISAHS